MPEGCHTGTHPEQSELAQEHGRLYYRAEDLRKLLAANPTPDLPAELAEVEAEHDRMAVRVAQLAQVEADKRTDAREAKFADAQADTEKLPPGPHREAAQTFLDDARLRGWEGDEWQTKFRSLMQGEVDDLG